MSLIFMSKRGISAIVATVLIILITVAAVTILWSFVIPIVSENLAFESLDGRVDIISSGGYTFYDEDDGIASVQIKRSNDESDLAEVRVVFGFGGSSVSSVVDSPEPGQTRAYAFDMGTNGRPDSISVYPIFLVGNKDVEGKKSSSTLNVVLGDYSGDDSSVNLLNQSSSDQDVLVTGLSCLDILNNGDSTGDGLYEINPAGIDPFEVYCDMTTDGGGWARIDYASDLEFIRHFTGGDSWRWFNENFTFVLSDEQISAIRSVSTEGRQTYVGNCSAVLHYYNNNVGYSNAFGFRFFDGSVTAHGSQNYPGTNIIVTRDDCSSNIVAVGVDLTIFEIIDQRLPIVNVYTRDNGNSVEQFGSVLTENPAWLR
jgi:flagellin-like protein